MGYIGAGLTRFNTADELTVTGDAEFDGNLTVKGTHITLDSATVQTVNLGDNDKILLGDGDDLQIYHTGADSYIVDAGTGDLYIRASNELRVQDGNQSNFLYAVEGGDLRLYHNGSEKFRTAATGVDVTGGLNTTGSVGIGTSSPSSFYSLADNLVVGTGSGGNGMTIYSGSADSGYIGFNDTASASMQGFIQYNHNGDYMAFAPNGSEKMRISSSGFVGIGESSPQKMLHITKNDSDGMIVLDANGSTTDHQICFTKNYGTGGTSGGNYWGIGVDGSENKLVFAYDPNSQASLAADAKVVLDSSGSVGIGTSSPIAQSKLTVAGNSLSLTGSDGDFGAGGVRGMLDLAGGYLRMGAVNGGGSANGLKLIAPAGQEALIVDSSGNVGILHSTPQFGLTMLQGNGDAARIGWEDGSNNKRASIICASSSDALQFHTGTSDTERMRLDSSGNLLVASTSLTNMWRGTGQNGTHLGWDYCASQYGSNTNLYMSKPSGYTDATYIAFFAVGSGVGSITTTGSSTSYNTSSDYRLKENVTADWDATTRLKQLNPVRFNFIADADTTVDGFLAHEVQDVVPEAISGTKDGMRDEEYTVSAATGDIYTPAVEATYDDDGVELTAAIDEVIHSADVERPEELAEDQLWRETTAAVMGTRSVPNYQGIDQSKLVPLLVKTIQELEARIAALETA